MAATASSRDGCTTNVPAEDAPWADWLRLTLTPGVGPRTACQLLARYTWPSQIFLQSHSDLAEIVGPRLAGALLAVPPQWTEHLQHCQRWLAATSQDGLARSVVTLADAGYPQALLTLDDPPPLLFVLGDMSRCQGHDPGHSLAMVGTRSPTPQGRQTAEAFARELASRGITIVSGLAHGIDTAAHVGALAADWPAAAAGAPTIAVVGTGLDRVYPRQNQALAHAIGQRGLLISEFPPGTPPLPGNFPKRNRLIAGLARGTLVVEAALRSGSLITARLAGEQGKDVFAIPGSIHNMQTRGCHALIRDGACLVESIHDILEEWQWAPAAGTSGEPFTPVTPDDDASCDDPLLEAMGTDPIDLDTLQARTGWPAAQLQARLLELELEGRVGRLPGPRFQRLAQA